MREAIPVSEALASYFDDLLLGGMSPGTIRVYRSLLKLEEWPTESSCRDVLRTRVQSGQSLKTIACVHAALKSFCAHAVMRGWLAVSPMVNIPAPKPKPPAHRYMTKPQVRAFYAACDTDENRLIVRLLLLGLRANELLALTLSDVGDDTLRVLHGKGGKHRLLPLDEETRGMIPARAPLFSMSYDALDDRIKRIGRRAGLPWVRCHDFRRSFATNWMLETNDAHTLQQLGGWSSDLMVRLYAKSALEASAVAKAREVGLTARLLG